MGLFSVKIARKAKSNTHVFTQHQNPDTSRRARTENVIVFAVCHAHLIIWIFPERLRCPLPSPFSLLKVPIRVEFVHVFFQFALKVIVYLLELTFSSIFKVSSSNGLSSSTCGGVFRDFMLKLFCCGLLDGSK